MKRVIYKGKEKEIIEIAAVLKQGGIIALPTDTIYGFSCNPFIKKTVLKIHQIKKRPDEKKMILLVSDLEMLQTYLDIEIPLSVKNLWPGANTVVLPVNSKIPEYLTFEDKTAFRIPDNLFLKTLVKYFGKPIVSTSLNVSGKECINNPDLIEQKFGSEIDMCVELEDWKPAASPSSVYIYNRKRLIQLR